MATTTFNLKYYGIEESCEFETEDMTEEELDRELVQWVLERVDHWRE